ncbi:MAG: hypothetical protein ACRETE_09205 [Stenotrophobium sp.]
MKEAPEVHDQREGRHPTARSHTRFAAQKHRVAGGRFLEWRGLRCQRAIMGSQC